MFRMVSLKMYKDKESDGGDKEERERKKHFG